MSIKLPVPTIHLNGTSAEELEAQLREVGDAVHRAMEAHADAAPHPRDYYVQQDDAFTQARAAFEARAQKLREVYREIAAIYEGVLARSEKRA